MLASLAVLMQGGQETHAVEGVFEPFFPGLVVLLPLLGFVLNGWLALSHAKASSAAVRAGGELVLDGPHGRPATHTLPTWIGPGVLLLAFLITLVNFVGAVGAVGQAPTPLHISTARPMPP